MTQVAAREVPASREHEAAGGVAQRDGRLDALAEHGRECGDRAPRVVGLLLMPDQHRALTAASDRQGESLTEFVVRAAIDHAEALAHNFELEASVAVPAMRWRRFVDLLDGRCGCATETDARQG